MIKAIFWDNDGVLVDTEGIFFRANQKVLAGLGIPLEARQFEEISLARGESVMRLAANPGTEAFSKLRRDRDALYAELLTRETLVIEGVRDVLDALRGKYVMGIVTSSGHEHFEIIHRQSGLLPYFQFVLTLKDCPYTKPHPGPYLKAIELSGFSPNECLVIEDSPRGLAAATSAGLRCIIIPSGFTHNFNFARACKVLDSIRDLPSALSEF
ncbi:MAG: HAD family hydrolase [Deltaproteobacteria bacterium HGW-Deltaproteobacteria-13]|jgi:HAD superfamily hydrolase (TIGR01509 family)|nr:MAG: HAD family hydrolase [Deltaproteobacteria bacterium HGW-Deltaproteobacteria-13]